MCLTTENRGSHWTLALPMGRRLQWDSEITGISGLSDPLVLATSSAPHSGTVLSEPFVQFTSFNSAQGANATTQPHGQLVTLLQSALTGPLRARAFASEFATSGSSNSEYLVRRVHGSTCALGNSTPPDSLSYRAI